jgi:Deacetylase PdaC
VKQLIAVLLGPSALSSAFVAVLLGSLCVSGNAQTPAAGSLRMEPVKQLRKGVDAWPMIVSTGTPAAQRVNETLTRLNRQLMQSLHDCDADYKSWLKAADHPENALNQISTDWSRTIKVTMEGPRFLSLVASDETFCGGAHPNGDVIAMVFDMTTGAPVDWTKMVVKSAGASVNSATLSDGSTAGALVLPALQKMNLAAAHADCKDAFQDPQPFLVWPDAKGGTLVAQPFDLPHVVQACANEISLTMDQARKLGFDKNLLTAIEQAHRQTSVTPKR